MTEITLNLPEELVLRVQALEEQLPEILELGMREFQASSQIGFKGAGEVLEFLASLPSPEEIITLRPNQTLQNQIDNLLEKNHSGSLTPSEEQLWQQYQYLEHLVRMAKAKAYLKLKQKQSSPHE